VNGFGDKLMLAMYRAGRRGDALRTYDRLQTVLDRELSVWPGVALERLESRTRSESADLERIPSPTAMPPT
jgi:DNA-binding SARP family transcriptional activator